MSDRYDDEFEGDFEDDEEEESFDSAEEAIEAWAADHGADLSQDTFNMLVELVEARAEVEGVVSVPEVVEDVQTIARAKENEARWEAIDAQIAELEQGLDIPSREERDAETIEQAGDEHADALWEESFQNGVRRLEQERGRELLAKEREQLKDALPADTDDELDVVGVWKDTIGRDGDPYDQSTSNGRTQFMTDRLHERRLAESPPPETVEKPAADASDGEWQSYMAARYQGAETAEPEPLAESPTEAA